LIHFDSLPLDSENDDIKSSLYDLFFVWQKDKFEDNEYDYNFNNKGIDNDEKTQRDKLN
jgi:hypothetical protein